MLRGAGEAGGKTKEMDPSMLTMSLSLLCQGQSLKPEL